MRSKIAGLGLGLAALLAGCDDPVPARVRAHRSGQILEENKKALVSNDIAPNTLEVEMEIADVQFGQVSYHRIPNSAITAHHPFQYVIGRGKDNKDHVFIYPVSSPILRKQAIFRVDPLPRGAISVLNFLKEYVRTDSDLESLNYDIPVEGVIQIGSISYQD